MPIDNIRYVCYDTGVGRKQTHERQQTMTHFLDQFTTPDYTADALDDLPMFLDDIEETLSEFTHVADNYPDTIRGLISDLHVDAAGLNAVFYEKLKAASDAGSAGTRADERFAVAADLAQITQMLSRVVGRIAKLEARVA